MSVIKSLWFTIAVGSSFLTCSGAVLANENQKICWITEAWPNFTQKDGSGIYHDLVSAVFETQNIEIQVQYAPWKRAVENVRNGLCDMTGGIERSEDFYQSKYPLYEYHDLIVFKKGSIEWKGLVSLEGNMGVWVRGYIHDDIDRPIKNYVKGLEVNDFEQALKILKAGRVKYLLSETQALNNYSKKLENLNLKDYEIIEVKSGQLYMSFTRNEQGRKYRDMYNKGLEAITVENISEIYKKWELSAPGLELHPEHN